METFSTNLRVLRAQHDLTQEQLAERVGVSRKTIVYLEKGEYVPSLTLAWNIAQVFSLPIESVFTIHTS
jgi:putative transcriptional regulator